MSEKLGVDDGYLMLKKIKDLRVVCNESGCGVHCKYYTQFKRNGYSCLFATLSDMVIEIEQKEKGR